MTGGGARQETAPQRLLDRNRSEIDTMRVVKTLLRMYPIASIRIQRNKFDPQLMLNPEINGVEYQHGRLFGWQERAYALETAQGRWVHCGGSKVRLELHHVRPRTISSDRVDNLVACCRDCNIAKGNQIIEQFLDNQLELLERIPKSPQRSDLVHAAYVNAALQGTPVGRPFRQ